MTPQAIDDGHKPSITAQAIGDAEGNR